MTAIPETIRYLNDLVTAAPQSGDQAAGGAGMRAANILDPGMDLTLRPMRYPEILRAHYLDAIRNTCGPVEEVQLSDDLVDLSRRLLPAERHLVRRLVAFFATGDSIVANNLVLNLYKHINTPEARLFLSRQLSVRGSPAHVQFYLTLLDTYVSDPRSASRRSRPSSMPRRSRPRQSSVSAGWGVSMTLTSFVTLRRTLPVRLEPDLLRWALASKACFSFAAFAYVYFLRSKGLLNGLAAGTNWVFRDESGHMDFAFAVVDTVRRGRTRALRRTIDERRYGHDGRRRRSFEDSLRRRPAGPTESPAYRWQTLAPTSNTQPTNGWLDWAFAKRFGSPNLLPRSCSYKTSRNSPTSSNERSRPTRWA